MELILVFSDDNMEPARQFCGNNGFYKFVNIYITTTTALWPFFRDHSGEMVPEDNFWTLWCKGRLTEADTQTIWLGTTPSGLTSAHCHHYPIFFTGWMPFLPLNQQRQSTEGISVIYQI